jgi:hypothetical protein
MTGNDTNTKGKTMNARELEMLKYVHNSKGVWNVTATPEALAMMNRLERKGVLRFVPRPGGNRGGDYIVADEVIRAACDAGEPVACPDAHLCRHGVEE